jgi:hypothetical protein
LPSTNGSADRARACQARSSWGWAAICHGDADFHGGVRDARDVVLVLHDPVCITVADAAAPHSGLAFMFWWGKVFSPSRSRFSTPQSSCLEARREPAAEHIRRQGVTSHRRGIGAELPTKVSVKTAQSAAAAARPWILLGCGQPKYVGLAPVAFDCDRSRRRA